MSEEIKNMMEELGEKVKWRMRGQKLHPEMGGRVVRMESGAKRLNSIIESDRRKEDGGEDV